MGKTLLTCGNDFLTCGNDLLTCGNDFLSCGNDLRTCGNNLVSCGNDLLTCGNDLVSCGNNLLTCGNKIKKMQGKQFYVPSRAPHLSPIRYLVLKYIKDLYKKSDFSQFEIHHLKFTVYNVGLISSILNISL